MSKPQVAKRPASAHSIPDAAWAEAVRRAAVIRPLAGERRLGRATVQAAARALGLSEPHVYCLVRAFRRHPVTASLAPSKPGPAMDARIEVAIDAVYLALSHLCHQGHFWSGEGGDTGAHVELEPPYGEPGHLYRQPGHFLWRSRGLFRGEKARWPEILAISDTRQRRRIFAWNGLRVNKPAYRS